MVSQRIGHLALGTVPLAYNLDTSENQILAA